MRDFNACALGLVSLAVILSGTSLAQAAGIRRSRKTARPVQNVAAADGRAMADFEKEWWRVMETNREFRDAVIKYHDLENEFNRARGATIRIPKPVFTSKGKQCEASTYTEYEQVGNVARASRAG